MAVVQESVTVVEESVDGVEIQPQMEVAFAQSETYPSTGQCDGTGEQITVSKEEASDESESISPGQQVQLEQQRQLQQQQDLPPSIQPEIVHLVTSLVGQGLAQANQQHYVVAENGSQQILIQPQEMETSTADISYGGVHDDSNYSGGMSDITSGKGRTRKLYPIKMKLEVVEYAKTHSKQATARHFKIHRRMVQRWCSEQDELIQYKNSDITRKPGAGMRPMYEKIDRKLAEFFKFCVDNGIHVTSHMLKTKALELHKMEEGGSSGFKASGGWLRGFMRRNGISFKEQTINPTLLIERGIGDDSGMLEGDNGHQLVYEEDPIGDRHDTSASDNEIMLPTDQVIHMDNVHFTTEVGGDGDIVTGELTTSNTLSLLLKRDGDDQDLSAFDEVVLPERTHHCLLQSIAVRYGTTTFGDLLKQKQRKDGSLIWVRISTDEDIHRLQDDDVIYIKDMKTE